MVVVNGISAEKQDDICVIEIGKLENVSAGNKSYGLVLSNNHDTPAVSTINNQQLHSYKLAGVVDVICISYSIVPDG